MLVLVVHEAMILAHLFRTTCVLTRTCGCCCCCCCCLLTHSDRALLLAVHEELRAARQALVAAAVPVAATGQGKDKQEEQEEQQPSQQLSQQQQQQQQELILVAGTSGGWDGAGGRHGAEAGARHELQRAGARRRGCLHTPCPTRHVALAVGSEQFRPRLHARTR